MLHTTKLSSKGQVVIPEGIRKQLKLGVGTRFVVVGHEGTVVLKTISEPSASEYEHLIREARIQAQKANLTPTDIAAIIEKVRRRI